ncbi:PDZ domain-containing protein [Chitinophaga sedimenti]|uniref:PDZ domain-containing protein n=1 Tax=Chitinophaga sedimenti TaxID=2033606 RepID=UPI0020038FE8|nr:PDZ domain-containing protein [Chitinophaga sedimenti]MCK7558951.1 PDZ domain-containing protein [Chitinophaga sedimenti]
MQFYRGEGDPIAPKAPSAVLGVITAKEDARGATVKQVSEGSAAEKAGLKEGDIITKVNDEAIREPQELFESIGTKKPGDEITITYLRDKKESRVKAKLDQRPESQIRSFNFGQDDDAFNFRSVPRGGDLDELFGRMERRGGGNEAKLGLSVQDTEEATGAKVLGVTEGSAAEKAGFKENDIITEIAGSAVRNARDVVSTYNVNKNKSEVSAKIIRGGKAQTLTVKVPKKLNKENL